MDDASERGQWALAALSRKGEELGYAVHAEYPVQGARLDLVWLASLTDLPGVDSLVPIAGFEIESSWRTRKHLKGDYLNLFDLGASIGVLVLLGEGEKVEATRRFAQILVDRPGPRIVVWSDEEIRSIAGQPSAAPAEAPSTNPSVPAASVCHVGKYRALWEWLTNQSEDSIPMSFGEVEEIIGLPLPPSSRRHASHWSGYEGSAVVRAIHDAGWRATEVSLEQERLIFRRARRPEVDPLRNE